MLGINLRALHLTTKEVGKLMIEQGYGRILSISSVKSLIGTDQDYIAYCASKGAVNMYTKQLACEWGKYGITVNAIAPTFTRTPINSFQLDDPAFYNKLDNEGFGLRGRLSVQRCGGVCQRAGALRGWRPDGQAVNGGKAA